MATKYLLVKQAIYSLAIDSLTDTDSTVTWGMVAQPPKRWVALGKTTWDSSEWGPIGRRARNEEFRVQMAFNVVADGYKPSEAEQMVSDYVSTFEDALRADPTLSSLVSEYGAELVPEEAFSNSTDNGAEAQITCAVRVKARI